MATGLSSANNDNPPHYSSSYSNRSPLSPPPRHPPPPLPTSYPHDPVPPIPRAITEGAPTSEPTVSRFPDLQPEDSATPVKRSPTATTSGISATRASDDEAARVLSDQTLDNTADQSSRTPSQSRSRKPSFSFLRRTKTEENEPEASGSPRKQRQRKDSFTSVRLRRRSESGTSTSGFYVDETPLPPRTLIAAATNDAMLRKSSRVRKEKEEQERQARKASYDPPHLPSLTPLQGISSFGGGVDDSPDSVAIFNHAYTTNNGGNPAMHPRTIGTNFSRPGNMAPTSDMNNSSSPAYTSRFAASGSSSPPDARFKTHGGGSSGEYVAVDPSFRPESMTNRGRFSYASTMSNVNGVNSPRRVRKRKDPTPFNVLVIGAKNSGKTCFINFLADSLALPAPKTPSYQPGSEGAAFQGFFTPTFVETEVEAERIGLTLWDSEGLEANIVEIQLREMTRFVESKFEETFAEEQKVKRTPGVKDTHIHCVFLILDPVRLDSTIAASSRQQGKRVGSLEDDLDLQVMRALFGKTTVIPIIAKADTVTTGHMSFLKRSVWDAVKSAGLDPLEALELEDDDIEEDKNEDAEDRDSSGDPDTPLHVSKTRKNQHHRQSSLSAINDTIINGANEKLPYVPMSIISPDPYDLPPFAPKSSTQKPGRRFPWGFADPHNADHCDYGRLKDTVFSELRNDLRELSRSSWYETWRTTRLKSLPGSRPRVKGGVTPTDVVPSDGRIASQGPRNFSPAQQAALPRSVSALSNGLGEQQQQRGSSGMSDGGSLRNGNPIMVAANSGSIRRNLS